MNVFSISPQGVFWIVQDIARRAGLGEIRPHDLRRTYAKLARSGGAPLEQISQTLGHASLKTTERYLGQELELREGKAAGDYIRVRTEKRKQADSDSESKGE